MANCVVACAFSYARELWVWVSCIPDSRLIHSVVLQIDLVLLSRRTSIAQYRGFAEVAATCLNRLHRISRHEFLVHSLPVFLMCLKTILVHPVFCLQVDNAALECPVCLEQALYYTWKSLISIKQLLHCTHLFQFISLQQKAGLSSRHRRFFNSTVCGGSIEPCDRWYAILQFCKDLVNSLTIGPVDTRVAVMTFGDMTNVEWNLKQ